MKRNQEIKVKVTQSEKDYLKASASPSNLSKYVRSKLFGDRDRGCTNLEVARASVKRVPELNRHVYLELSEISSELERLGNWGEDLSKSDRTTVAAIRARIAQIGLSAVGKRDLED